MLTPGPFAATGLLIDRDPQSDALGAKPHGRADMICCVGRSTLAVAVALVSKGAVPVAVLLTATALVAAIQLYTALRLLPYYHQIMNRYNGAYAAAFAWATFCAVMAHTRNKPGEQVRVRTDVHACTALSAQPSLDSTLFRLPPTPRPPTCPHSWRATSLRSHCPLLP